MLEIAWLSRRPSSVISAPPLVLRRFDPEHAPALTEAVNQSIEHLRPWMAWANSPVTVEAEATLLREARSRFDAGEDFAYLMFVEERGELVGACGLHPRQGPGVLEIGYWVHVDHTLQGFATAAARALTGEALDIPSVHEVQIRCDVANTASAAVPARIGFTMARVQDRPRRTSSETDEEMVWVLTRLP